jgi:hypothetical protein
MEASLPQAVTLKASLIMALAALLELYGLFAHSDRVSYKKTSETIEEMVTIAGGFSCVDYPYLDPPVGVRAWFCADYGMSFYILMWSVLVV